MVKSKLKLGLIFGGKSGEHEVSLASAANIYRALDKNKYDITLIAIDKQGHWHWQQDPEAFANTVNARTYVIQKAPAIILPYRTTHNFRLLNDPTFSQTIDVVFPVLHGTNGEDGTIQGLLELAEIPYVGSGVLGSALAMDKDLSKHALKSIDVPVVDWFAVRKQEFAQDPKGIINRAQREFGGTYFVKPANAGSSVGVHKIKSIDTAHAAIEDAFKYDVKVLIERAIDARELEVAVLGNTQPQASAVGELVTQHEFYSYEAKYLDDAGTSFYIPAQHLTSEQAEQIKTYATRAFVALECRGLARIDFFIDKISNKIYLNELNTIPGFTQISMYPKLWGASGISYTDLLDRLINLAIENRTTYDGLSRDFSGTFTG